MQNKDHLLFQLDYMKVLLEEDRYGETFDKAKELIQNLEQTCKSIYAKFDNGEIELSKALTKTKPNQWVFLNKTWIKVLQITKNEITFEINKGNILKRIYNLRNEKHLVK